MQAPEFRSPNTFRRAPQLQTIDGKSEKDNEDDRTKAKHTAARRWVEAVNNWGQLGTWVFHVCRDLRLLAKEMEWLAA